MEDSSQIEELREELAILLFANGERGGRAWTPAARWRRLSQENREIYLRMADIAIDYVSDRIPRGTELRPDDV